MLLVLLSEERGSNGEREFTSAPLLVLVEVLPSSSTPTGQIRTPTYEDAPRGSGPDGTVLSSARTQEAHECDEVLQK